MHAHVHVHVHVDLDVRVHVDEITDNMIQIYRSQMHTYEHIVGILILLTLLGSILVSSGPAFTHANSMGTVRLLKYEKRT